MIRLIDLRNKEQQQQTKYAIKCRVQFLPNKYAAEATNSISSMYVSKAGSPHYNSYKTTSLYNLSVF